MRFFVRLLRVLALIALAAAATVFALSHSKLSQRYAVAAAAVPAPGTSEAILRGRHIAAIRGCSTCHGADLGGAKVMDNAAMGRVYGPNLTRGRGGAGSLLSHEDIIRAVRDGVRPDGLPLFIMPSKDYVAMSDEDLGALLAYVDSAAPVDRDVPSIEVGPVARVLLAIGKTRLSAEVIDHSRPPAPVHVGIEITPAYGSYLASTCSGCHNPHFSGGRISEGPPDWPPAANLTHGTGSAIAGWSEADFIRALRTATKPDGTAVNPVMPRVFGQMSDVELKALWSYLQTLPPAATGHSPSPGI